MFCSNLKKLSSFIVCFICLTGAVFAAPIKVVTITEDFASIAKTIGGDKVDVVSLIKGSRNLHNINPKPSMVMTIKKADLLVRLGMGQDTWIDGLIQVAKNAKIFSGENGYLDCSIEVSKLSSAWKYRWK